MFLTAKKGRWYNISEVINSRKVFGGVNPFNIVILNNVWNREFKSLSAYCKLYGVDKDIVLLKPSNSTIANEILIRKDEILKDLNKYFKSKWLKDIKIV